MLDTPQGRADRERNDQLMATLDDLNRKMGRGTVTFGRSSPGAAWHLRCANRTPRWTTHWDELPRITAR